MIEEIQNKNQLEEERGRDEMMKNSDSESNNRQENVAPEMPRNPQNIGEKMKELSTLAKPMKALSIVLEIEPLKDWVYFLALTGAILKDFLDILEGVIVLHGLLVVATFCISIFIALMMILANALEEQKTTGRIMMKKWLVLFGATTGELIIGVDFLPIETMAVIVIYALALLARKQVKEEKKKQKKISLAYA